MLVLWMVWMTVSVGAQSHKLTKNLPPPPDPATQRFQVSGGKLQEIKPESPKDSTLNSLLLSPLDSLKRSERDTTLKKSRKQERALDTVRYSALFRDTIPISRVCAISLIAPGFGQLYNKQAWKMPILYGSVGALAYFGFQENSKYKPLRKEYDRLVSLGAGRDQLEPVQNQMIKRNTARTILLTGAIAGYIYFIGDAAMNYKGPANSVKKATTLSTICPGAGQFYNGSYWKVPIVVGAFATMGYIIDYNSRGYNRYKTAYNLLTDGDDATVDEFNGRYPAEYMKTLKNSYRRNRDLSIIITAGLYLLNIVDAHVDAHLRDYDISDDLAISVTPTIMSSYTQRSQQTNGIGMAFSVRF